MTLARQRGWGLTTVDLGGPVSDALTDRRHEGVTQVADVLATLPVALLVRL